MVRAPTIPFWATRECRWLIAILVMAASTLLVLYFEILPGLEERLPKPPAPEDLAAFPLPDPRDPKDPVNIRFGGLAGAVEDPTPIETIDTPYLALLDSLRESKPEAIAAEARTIAHALFLEAPERLRGRAFGVRSLWLEWRPVRLPGALRGAESVFRCFLVDPSGSDGAVVDVLEAPPRFEYRALVGFEGLFLRIASYEGRRGEVKAPHFLAWRLRTLEREPAAAAIDPRLAIAGIAVLSAALLALTAWLYVRARRERSLQALAPRPRR
jgi:hypothetical protein